MKSLLTLMCLTFMFQAKATIPVCFLKGSIDPYGQAISSSYNFVNTVTETRNNNTQLRCGENEVHNPDSIYLKSELDAQLIKSNNLLNSNVLKTNSLEKRVFNIEQAMSQDIQIPDSVKEDLKKQIIEELKQEFILTPKK